MSQLKPPGYAGYNLYYAALQSKLGISAGTLVKSSPGIVATVTVLTHSEVAGAVYDSLDDDEGSDAKKIFTVPDGATVGSVFQLNFPFSEGLVVTPGTDGVLSVSFT